MIAERERTYDEGEELDDEEEEDTACEECGEELNQWGSCPNRCHMSEAEKKDDDLNTIGCEEYHASLYEDEDESYTCESIERVK